MRTRVTVVPLTRTVRGIASEVRLGPNDGVAKVCVANADELVTVPRDLLGQRITALSREKVVELDDALRFCLALEPTRPA